jgi:hypothetical protein
MKAAGDLDDGANRDNPNYATECDIPQRGIE